MRVSSHLPGRSVAREISKPSSSGTASEAKPAGCAVPRATLARCVLQACASCETSLPGLYFSLMKIPPSQPARRGLRGRPYKFAIRANICVVGWIIRCVSAISTPCGCCGSPPNGNAIYSAIPRACQAQAGRLDRTLPRRLLVLSQPRLEQAGDRAPRAVSP